jgi:hypothetical protein
MKKRLLQILPLILLAVLATKLNAQAKLAIYGTAGTESSGLPYNPWKLAGTLGLYYGLYDFGPFYLSVDARGDISSAIHSGFGGPRLAVKLPVLPIKPYGEILIGVSSYPQTSGSIQYSNDFAYRYVLGVDSSIFPHIDWRIADFSYGINRSGNGTGTHAETITSGLVIRF